MSTIPKNLDAWLGYIAQSHPSEIELGLDRIKSVYEKMSFETMPSKVVVVAGTNGKGSTIAMSAAGLSSLGLKCGTYTSPHILEYNERVQLLGKNVSDEALVQAFEYVEQVRGDTPLTYFEFGTLAAFYILFNADLDVALLEIGLGGRLDAVNIVDADISVITSIDIDHKEWLGDNIEKIGFEKAGVLRQGQQFLAGENLPDSVFDQSRLLGCKQKVCHVDFKRMGFNFELSDDQGDVRLFSGFPELELPDNNVLLALELIYLLALPSKFNSDQVCKALTAVKLPGRLEQSASVPNLYFDVGHNPHAARFLSSFLKKKRAQGYHIEAVYSALGDKDIDGVVRELASDVDSWLIAPLTIDRAISLPELKAKVEAYTDSVKCYESIALALSDGALKKSGESYVNTNAKPKLVLVFGSFFTVEAAKKYLENE